MHWKRAIAVVATATLALTACGSPSKTGGPGGGGTIANEAQEKAVDATAKGPAKEVEGAKKGGVITILSDVVPETFDGTNCYYTDCNQIGKLFLRALTQYKLDEKTGKPILVPDLAEDLGTASADGLTWTFKIKQGMKYHDGSPIVAADFAYAIKRQFAHDIFDEGPTYLIQYAKGGDKYKGPYGPEGDKYDGVEAPDDHTLVIHLAKKFPDMPYYAAFPAFSPIPKAKDTRQNYEKNPMSTGPYMVTSYSPGVELKLTKNPNWDANSDPVRHQYVDGWDFKFGQDTIKAQRQVLKSAGKDANALNYSNLDSTLLPEVKDEAAQIVKGPGPCTTYWQFDARKDPLEIRKLVAKAYPYDALRKVLGLTTIADPKAHTILPPAVPGWTDYSIPGLTGEGKGGDDAKIAADVKAELQKMGKVDYPLSWYYSNDDPISTRGSQVRQGALEKAGFKVKAIGVPKAKRRELANDIHASTDMKGGGWCSDWPSQSSWFPTMFRSDAIELQNSFGYLSDKTLDAEIDRVNNLSPDEQLKQAGALDKKILEEYLPVLPISYSQSYLPIGKNIGHAINDMTQGLPEFTSMYLKQS
jgi:peptide/nickel transport system substrate-binding protein